MGRGRPALDRGGAAGRHQREQLALDREERRSVEQGQVKGAPLQVRNTMARIHFSCLLSSLTHV